MSEISKKRGEFGEKVTENLLQIIGWENLLSNREIECYNPSDHAITYKNRKDHGVDFIYKYDCPLFSDTEMFVLVSSKINDEYPSNPSNRFKSHLRDVAYATECFKKSNLRSKIKKQNATYHFRHSSVVFWIDNKSEYDDVIERLTDFRVDDDLEFETTYLVDNKRADFLFATIDFVKNKFSDYEMHFFHPSTGFNVSARHRLNSSKILPVQYINSSVLPIRIFKENKECLILSCIDAFESEYLQKLINLAQKLTNNWSQKVYILFPEYNEDTHRDKVDDIKLGFKDQNFVSKIIVSTYNPNFRNIEL